MNTWECGTPRSSDNAFSILYQPRAIPDSKSPPRKRGPRPSKHYQTLTAFETPEERKARHKAEKEAKILRKNPYSDVSRSFPTQADRTNQITGRRIGARHQ